MLGVGPRLTESPRSLAQARGDLLDEGDEGFVADSLAYRHLALLIDGLREGRGDSVNMLPGQKATPRGVAGEVSRVGGGRAGGPLNPPSWGTLSGWHLVITAPATRESPHAWGI